ncbi:unnamed protein product, partial [Mesorhabditis spiculigera]
MSVVRRGLAEKTNLNHGDVLQKRNLDKPVTPARRMERTLFDGPTDAKLEANVKTTPHISKAGTSSPGLDAIEAFGRKDNEFLFFPITPARKTTGKVLLEEAVLTEELTPSEPLEYFGEDDGEMERINLEEFDHGFCRLQERDYDLENTHPADISISDLTEGELADAERLFAELEKAPSVATAGH